jgi:hypothetical protein
MECTVIRLEQDHRHAWMIIDLGGGQELRIKGQARRAKVGG